MATKNFFLGGGGGTMFLQIWGNPVGCGIFSLNKLKTVKFLPQNPAQLLDWVGSRLKFFLPNFRFLTFLETLKNLFPFFFTKRRSIGCAQKKTPSISNLFKPQTVFRSVVKANVYFSAEKFLLKQKWS
jgi:hypothetical protein